MKTLGTVALALALATGWTLPARGETRDKRPPRTYRFTNTYTATSPLGDVLQRHRLTAEYTRGLPGDEVVWRDVVAAVADGPDAALPPGERREFMEGFRYGRGPAAGGAAFQPQFFEGFPPAAVHERNLVWDVLMLEWFGEELQHLELNEPYHLVKGQDVALAGAGTFHNKDVRLVWVGRSRRNGRDCAVIEFTAFFNKLRVDAGGVGLLGLSHYWGQIWVSTSTRWVEYATIQEVVYGELKLPGQEAALPMHVFRESVLEPTPAR